MIGAGSQIGEVSLLAKIDTANYKKGAREIDQANKSISSSTEKHSGRAGAALHKFANVAKIGLLAAGAAATAFAVTSVKAFMESENIATQLNAVLKSTGGAAGVTAKAAIDLSKSLQKVTKFSDEEVLSAENLLLTFTSIGKEVFPQATETVLDMSAALGQDLKSSSVQLGKALNNPIKGVTALQRVGVQFTDKQKETIATLVESGKTMEAQKLILKELQIEFGGSAKAAGDTFAGKLAKLKNTVNDVQEVLGQAIVKGLAPFATKALEAVASVDWTSVINRTITVLGTLWKTYLVPIVQAIKNVGIAVAEYLAPKLEAVWHTIKNDLWPAIQNFAKAIGPTVGVGLVWAIGVAIDAFNVLLKVASPVIQWLSDHTWVVWGLATAFVAVKTAMFLQGALAAFSAVMAGVQVATLPTIAQLGLLRGSFTLLAATISSPIIMPAIAIGAALLSLWKIRDAAFDAMDAVRNATNAQDSLAESNFAVKRRLQALLLSNDPVVRDRAAKTLKGLGFAEGGFTGFGSTDEIAGVVHRGEFVFPKSAVDQSTGLPKAAAGNVYVTLNLSGIMARSRSDLRDIGRDLIESVNEILRARQLPEIGGGNI